MEIFMKGTSKMAFFMVKEFTAGKMDASLKEPIEKAKSMDSEF